MNEIMELQQIVDEHFIQVGKWVAEQQEHLNSIEDVVVVFSKAEIRAKEGLAKVDAINLPNHTKFIRLMFQKQIAAYNYAARKNFKKAVKIANEAKKLALAYERRMKGNG